MKHRSLTPRIIKNRAVVVISVMAASIGILALGWILWEVTRRGVGALDLAFFTSLPTPPGMEGGGLANALLGTLMLTTIATVIGVPLGLMAGVYLSEFGKQSKVASIIRFNINVLMGVPSIIVGLFVYALVVLRSGTFSGWAGSLALAILMLPVVARTSEDMLSMVPNELRESALALGIPRWRTTLGIVFRAAQRGLVTGGLLAVARVSGETAPLLFTSLNSPFWPSDLGGPTANVTVSIFNYAMSPYRDWQQMAWGASLVIMACVLLLTVGARWLLREKRS